MIVDASVLFALLDRRDGRHAAVSRWYRETNDVMATTPLILTELDFLAGRLGPESQGAWRRDLARGAYEIHWWEGAARESCEIAESYPGFGVSLADASLVALARRLNTNVVATLDERHFRAMRPLTRHAAFTLFPADA